MSMFLHGWTDAAYFSPAALLLFYSVEDMLDTIRAGIVYFVNFIDYLLDIIGNSDKIHSGVLVVYGQDAAPGDISRCRRAAERAAV